MNDLPPTNAVPRIESSFPEKPVQSSLTCLKTLASEKLARVFSDRTTETCENFSYFVHIIKKKSLKSLLWNHWFKKFFGKTASAKGRYTM